jgi:peptidylprolyl isomerase/FKBP-type peptidyl-prolyl cis-trans isomerase FklB
MATALAMAANGALAAPKAAPPVDPEKAYFGKLAKQAGAVALPGIAYVVLKSGPVDAPHPARSDTVTVHYIGRLTDGTQFDASGGDGSGEASFTVGGVIAGFGAALKLMRPGDRWTVSIPAYLAYGDQAKPKIPAGSTLVFEIELVSIAPKAAS